MDVGYLMQRQAQGPTTLGWMVTDCGAPIKLKSDNNASEFKSKTWTSFIYKMSIKPGFTEAHHPNKNLAERHGAIEAATVHLLRVTGCPLGFWC